MPGLPAKLLVAGLLIAGTGACAAEQLPETASASRGRPTAAEAPPNIVYVLADDLSWDLVRHMPQVRRLQRQGMTFRQFVVADSLCCSSRATILTGEFPHNTRVRTNTRPEGGYWAFKAHGGRRRSVAIALQRAGYRTAIMGKYLNGYSPYLEGRDPGWDEWLVSSLAYRGFGYRLSDNGRRAYAGFRPHNYLTDMIARRGARFIRRTAGEHPFFLTLSSFAPHRPATPAPRHRRMFRRLRLPRGRSFDAQVKGPPTWLGRRVRLSAAARRRLVRHHRRRARAVQALDELIGRVRATLRRAGVEDSTYIVFGSDNGYHLGQHRLTFGKRTAFDHDVRVPLVVVGPGVRAGGTTSALSGTVDLAPTFEAWAGLAPNPRRDGRSLTPLLDGAPPRRWRRALTIEHLAPGLRAGDPDVQGWAMGMPSSYTALRTARSTYVEYRNGDRELYDRRRDPAELRNRAGSLSRAKRRRLHAALRRYRDCRGAAECWRAGRARRIPRGY